MAKKKEEQPVISVKEGHARMPVPKGKLLAIGGKESKKDGAETEAQRKNRDFENEQILKCFVDELKGDNPMVAVLPTASSDPEKSAEDYIKVFTKLGVKD